MVRRNRARRNTRVTVNNRSRELKHISRALEGVPLQVYCPPRIPRVRFSHDVSRILAFEVLFAEGTTQDKNSYFGSIADPGIIIMGTDTSTNPSLPTTKVVSKFSMSMEVLARHVMASNLPKDLYSSGATVSGKLDIAKSSLFSSIRLHSFSFWGPTWSTDAGCPIELGVSTRFCSASAGYEPTLMKSSMIRARDEGDRNMRSHVKISCPRPVAYVLSAGKVYPEQTNFVAFNLEIGTIGMTFPTSTAVDRNLLAGVLHVSYTGTICVTEDQLLTAEIVDGETFDNNIDTLSDSESIELVSQRGSMRSRTKEVRHRPSQRM